MTNVMTNAWEIARQGVKEFGGQVKEYFAEALRIAWDLFKNTNSKEMEEMELVKEVKFGKAVAKITVKGTLLNETFSQFIEGGELITNVKIEVVSNGRVVDTGIHASAMEFNEIYDRTYTKNNLVASKTYTQIKGKKNVMFCEGKETAEAINTAIEEMINTITVELKGEAAEVNAVDPVVGAKEIIAAAEVQGVKNLMTAKEIKEWRKNYNKVANEDGEGFIPNRISLEQYQAALKVLN